MKNSGIYCFKNSVNNKVYIGSSKSLDFRRRQHLSDLRCNNHSNIRLQNFVNKYGIDVLEYEVLEYCDIEDLTTIEQKYLDLYSNKFNICLKADRPNVNRKLTEIDIKNIAKLFNSGKSCTEISRIYFNSKHRQNYIASIIKGEIFAEYKYLFNEYKTYNYKSFTEQDIIKIAELYNSGKTACQISEILYGCRNNRAKINSLVSGKTYKEFFHLFNYRKYSQLGKKRK